MAAKTLYVGNIPYSATEEDLFNHFSSYDPSQARIVEGRGFAFIDVDGDRLQDAIDTLHQSEMGGRRITVNEARPKGSGGGGGGGYNRDRNDRDGGGYGGGGRDRY